MLVNSILLISVSWSSLNAARVSCSCCFSSVMLPNVLKNKGLSLAEKARWLFVDCKCKARSRWLKPRKCCCDRLMIRIPCIIKLYKLQGIETTYKLLKTFEYCSVKYSRTDTWYTPSPLGESVLQTKMSHYYVCNNVNEETLKHHRLMLLLWPLQSV